MPLRDVAAVVYLLIGGLIMQLLGRIHTTRAQAGATRPSNQEIS
jgi:hypothetical protein